MARTSPLVLFPRWWPAPFFRSSQSWWPALVTWFPQVRWPALERLAPQTIKANPSIKVLARWSAARSPRKPDPRSHPGLRCGSRSSPSRRQPHPTTPPPSGSRPGGRTASSHTWSSNTRSVGRSSTMVLHDVNSPLIHCGAHQEDGSPLSLHGTRKPTGPLFSLGAPPKWWPARFLWFTPGA